MRIALGNANIPLLARRCDPYLAHALVIEGRGDQRCSGTAVSRGHNPLGSQEFLESHVAPQHLQVAQMFPAQERVRA